VAIDFDQLQDEIEARRRELGITDADDRACMNDGLARTPEKRAFLARIAERARAAGLEPFEANY